MTVAYATPQIDLAREAIVRRQQRTPRIVETDLKTLQSQVSIGPDGEIRDIACIWATSQFRPSSEQSSEGRVTFAGLDVGGNNPLFREHGSPHGGLCSFSETFFSLGNSDFPSIAMWLGLPNVSKVYLPVASEGDWGQIWKEKHFSTWFDAAGFNSSFEIVKSYSALHEKLTTSNRQLYCCDRIFDGTSLESRQIPSRDPYLQLSRKDQIFELAGPFAPPGITLDPRRDQFNPAQFDQLKGDREGVYVKMCNTQHGGTAVFFCKSHARVELVRQYVADCITYYNLHPSLIVVQPQLSTPYIGMQLFFPHGTSNVYLVGTKISYDEDTERKDHFYLGYPPGYKTQLAEMALYYAKKVRSKFPDAFGYLDLDMMINPFSNSRQKALCVIDSAFRPSASTPGFLALHWLRSRGIDRVFANREYDWEPKVSYTKLRETLDLDTLLTTGRGIVPLSIRGSKGKIYSHDLLYITPATS